MPRIGTGVPIVDVLIMTAAVLTALGVIWTKALRPIIHAAKRTEETLPVVLAIAREFEKNGGSSLKDTIDSLSASAQELYEYTHGFKHDFVNWRTVLIGKQDLLEEKVDELSGEVSTIKQDVAQVKSIVDRQEHP